MGGKLSLNRHARQQHALNNTLHSSSAEQNYSNPDDGKRIVLLGNTSSGKTTICEMIQYHKQHQTTAQSHYKQWYKVDTNTISKIIIEKVLYSATDSTIEEIIREYSKGGSIFDDSTLVALWNDQRFRAIYLKNQDTLNLFENVDIFVNKLKKNESFIPDIYIKGGSSGIIDYDINFDSENKNVKLITAGGKTYERRKWTFCLERNVSVLIYVVSLAEFNQTTCCGDENVNRMDESLKLYKELMANLSNRDNTRVVLLFTKPDIMMKKLRNFVEFGRNFESETLPEFTKIVNDYHERDVVNTIVTSYLKESNCNNGKVPEYHIVKSISDLDISQVAKLMVNNNERNCHYVSNCLFEKIALSRCYQLKMAQQLTDLLIICQQ